MSSERKKERIFRFKQFCIRHHVSGMKVGTDGVLLGAWADVSGVSRILDIGAGTGLIALMLAQRTNATVEIEGVEIEENAFKEALENVAHSPWHEQIKLHHTSIQQFSTPHEYDLIVSNPPYFKNSFKPTDSQRVIARHNENLSFHDLIAASLQLLTSEGKLNLILPFTEGFEFERLATKSGLYCSRKWSFKTREEKPIERWLLEFSRNKKSVEPNEILLYKRGEEWSDAYRTLTGEFYLKL